MGVREMFLVSKADMERVKSRNPSTPVPEDPNHVARGGDIEDEVVNDGEPEGNDVQVIGEVTGNESSTGVKLLELALEGVNPKYKTSAFQLLKHLSFINKSSPRFLFDTADFGIIIDGKKIAKSNLVEIINIAFKRSAPITNATQHEREKAKLNIPGFFAFLRLLSSIGYLLICITDKSTSGIPSSMFGNVIVADFIRRSRR